MLDMSGGDRARMTQFTEVDAIENAVAGYDPD
jgi:hypothetical protein